MSKRSVDKGDGGKGTPARAREAGAAEVSSIPTERKARAKAEARGPAGIWQNSELYWYAGLVLAALFSFYLRAIVPWKSVFVGDSVIFSSESDAWYHMILAKGTVINLQRLWFDPMTYFPHGTPLHFGPFVSWIITIFSYIFGLGHPSMHLVEVVGAFLPAVEGALLVFPVYFIGKELGGKSCGLISALMVAVLPGQLFSRTVLGFTDHHASEVLLSTTAVMFFLLAMRHGRGMTFAGVLKSWSSSRRPLLYSVLAGVFLGLYIDAWASGFLFEGMILLFIFLQSIVDHVKGRRVDYLGISGAITFFVATLIILPFVKPYYGFNHYLYSLFQPTILLLGVVTVLLFAFLSNFLRERGYSSFYYPGALALIMVAGTMVLSLAAPQFTSPLFTGLNIFSPKTGGAATVGEAAPLLFYQGELSFSTMLSNFPGMGNIIVLSTFFLAILGMVLVLGRYVKSQRPVDLLLLTWSVMLLAMTLAQNRFAYYYEVNVALLTGYLIVSILSLADLKSDEKIDARHIATGMLLPLLLMLIISANPGLLLSSTLAILIMALVIQPVIWIGYSRLKRISFKKEDLLGSLLLAVLFVIIVAPSVSTSFVVAHYTGGPDSDWMTSTAWLMNNTPSPGMDLYEKYQRPASGQYAYPAAAYGIMSWWDYGHLIETIGHRIPNANPFQQGIGSVTKGVAGSSPFFLAENETQGEKVLAALDQNRSLYMNTRYVMIDLDMATGKFHAMAAWSGIPNSKYMAAVYQEQGDQLVPVQIWRESYFKTMTARMYFFDGTEVTPSDGVGLAYRGVDLESGARVPVLTIAPMITRNQSELEAFVNERRNQSDLAEIAGMNPTDAAFPLEALQHYRLVHESERAVTTDGQKFVKTFEHVLGAVIEGDASPGSTVRIAAPIITNKERVFLYQQSNVTSSQGKFTLVVPYATEGPIAGGTNFDTKPMSAYQLSVGDKTYEVRVPEEYVLSGTVISL